MPLTSEIPLENATENPSEKLLLKIHDGFRGADFWCAIFCLNNRLLLYYTILYYTILYYTILYYTVLYCTVLYCTILLEAVQPAASNLYERAPGGRTLASRDLAQCVARTTASDNVLVFLCVCVCVYTYIYIYSIYIYIYTYIHTMYQPEREPPEDLERGALYYNII